MNSRLKNVLALVGMATIFVVQPFIGIAIVLMYLLKGK
jgi:hypothetical protein